MDAVGYIVYNRVKTQTSKIKRFWRFLNLHIHDVAICRDNFVTELDRRLQADIGFLGLDHQIRQANPVIAGHKSIAHLLCFQLYLICLIKRALEHV